MANTLAGEELDTPASKLDTKLSAESSADAFAEFVDAEEARARIQSKLCDDEIRFNLGLTVTKFD